MRFAATFLFGLLLAFDAVLPVGANVRTGDLISLLCVGMFCWSVLAGVRVDRAALVLGVLLLVSMEWVAAEAWVSGWSSADPKVQVVLGRWLLGTFSAYMMFRLSNVPRCRTALFLGIIAGTLCGFETVVRDWQTFDLTVQMPTLALEDQVFIDGVYRAMGMYSHPNEAAGVVLLGAPIVIGLVEERRLPRLALLAVLALACAVFWITKSRSQALVVVLLLGLWAVRNSPRLLLLAAVGGAVAGMAAMLGVLPGLGGDAASGRLMDADLGDNATDRLGTMMESFAIVLQQPFGVGSTYTETLYRATGFTATHNAFLQLAMMGGVPLMLLVLVGLIGAGWSLRRRTPYRVEGWLALYLLCIFNVENYFFVSVMSVMAQFLLAAAWRRPAVVAMAQPQPEPPPRVALAPPPSRRRIDHAPPLLR
jgi:hypothetical protein